MLLFGRILGHSVSNLCQVSYLAFNAHQYSVPLLRTIVR